MTIRRLHRRTRTFRHHRPVDIRPATGLRPRPAIRSRRYGQAGGYPPPLQYGAGNPGGLGIRFAARVIDGILVGIIAFPCWHSSSDCRATSW